ncbi:hypothetical protein DB811_07530 [Xanthomonas perforans]|nr:hypothetical protein DB767_19805 [Xanthomonas perforans]RXE10166.1 hypothetical protein DB804_15560 [Xanthomonas perforans]RXE25837.1 hypothetical protein DB829_09175 [Xanthomonas perforans]TQT76820.1 hypothetical protein DB760_10900 [Xanthomonas perforans]TQT87017.1 hypothetical protein DB778_20425 [Xanthomonas perforans]
MSERRPDRPVYEWRPGMPSAATTCAGALVTVPGEVNSQTATLPITFSGCRFAFDGECVKRLTRITDS